MTSISPGFHAHLCHFSLGLAAGPLIFGPASEMLGRRVIYIITGIGYTGETSLHQVLGEEVADVLSAAFSFGVAFAPNSHTLLASRFFVGFFGSSPMNTVPASIGDFTTAAERGPYTILCEFKVESGAS